MDRCASCWIKLTLDTHWYHRAGYALCTRCIHDTQRKMNHIRAWIAGAA